MSFFVCLFMDVVGSQIAPDRFLKLIGICFLDESVQDVGLRDVYLICKHPSVPIMPIHRILCKEEEKAKGDAQMIENILKVTHQLAYLLRQASEDQFKPHLGINIHNVMVCEIMEILDGF